MSHCTSNCLSHISTLVLKKDKYMNISITQHSTFAQVCLPGLHIKLGIFYRRFTLLEDTCHELDLRVVLEDSIDDGGVSYGRYVEAVQN